ncbi:hypothetical protein VFPPC_05944 [Pochonia chlamydosporia 170]|uniref:Heterokaryon incompatibility domain-containing protein n=1 Tax=Pochonia chlamydosporia 170 TaxID=1380566 RepID=A0A179FH19_METCM|nr:hypothetical protein VFPPC_05944 [Pochonia chlamydosporia 170]OAQ64707.2 hypothetical protein VFPPC_05944 [Pochonia chlamydosporia 170]
MMHMIYSAADNVVIWLGPGNPHTDFALDLMNSAEFRKRLWELPFLGRQPFENEILLDVIFKHDLCRRDWWQRLWVRQEFILATNEPIICCGSRAIAWSDIVGCFASLPRLWNYPDCAKIWEDCRNRLSSVLSRRHDTVGIHPMSLDRIRNSFHESKALPLHDAFRYVLRNSAATNPRDLIYGLLGLLEKHDRDRLTVDYTLEPMTVYRQAAYLLWAEHSEQLLSTLLPTLSFRGSSSVHPSWVPDFAASKIRGWQDHKTMQADKPWGRQSNSLFDNNKSILRLNGVLFDTVESTTQAPDTFDDIQEILPFLRHAESLLSEAVNRPILSEHPLWPMRDLKNQESVLKTLTKSAVSSEDLFPGFSDQSIWDLLLSTRVQNQVDDDSAQTETNIRSKLFARLSTMLRGKVTGRKALTTASGFVGVGVSQIKAGDIITLIFGATAPLVLRCSGDEFNIVGSAYISGLMDPEILDSYTERLKSRETFFNIG